MTASCRTSRQKRCDLRAAEWRVARDSGGPTRSARRDHGTARAQDGHQCAQLRCERVHGGLRGFVVPDLGQPDRGPSQPDASGAPRSHAHEPRRQVLPAPRKDRGPAGATARLAPARKALDARRRADRRRVHGFRPVPAPQRRRAPAPRNGTVLLPAETGESLRGETVGRGHRTRRARARAAARNGEGHGPHRDHHGRIRDRRDPP